MIKKSLIIEQIRSMNPEKKRQFKKDYYRMYNFYHSVKLGVTSVRSPEESICVFKYARVMRCYFSMIAYPLQLKDAWDIVLALSESEEIITELKNVESI